MFGKKLMVSVNLYLAMKTIHIVGVSFWLAGLPINTVIRLLARRFEEHERKIILYLSPVGKFLMLMGLLVFISGSGMTGSSWFVFSYNAWLAVKQVIFFFILLVGIFYYQRASNKLVELANSDVPIEEVRKLNKSMLFIEHSFSALIIVNIILAVFKPF